ncbi:MAG: hypothetical protein ACI8Q6_003391, partial [Granulosicoccus sp.]
DSRRPLQKLTPNFDLILIRQQASATVGFCILLFPMVFFEFDQAGTDRPHSTEVTSTGCSQHCAVLSDALTRRISGRMKRRRPCPEICL